MVTHLIATAWLLITPLASDSTGQTNVSTDRRFSSCLLYPDEAGTVWVLHPLVSLGMIGTMEAPPVRLNEQAAANLCSLATPFVWAPNYKPTDPYLYGLPAPLEKDRPIILVTVEGAVHAVDLPAPPPSSSPSSGQRLDYWPRSAHQLNDVALVEVEFIAPAWHAAQGAATRNLGELTKLTLEPPLPFTARKAEARGWVDCGSMR